MKVKSQWASRGIMAAAVLAVAVVSPMAPVSAPAKAQAAVKNAGKSVSKNKSKGAEVNQNRPWLDSKRSAKERTALLLQAMTLSEKVDFVTGNVNNYYGFYNSPIERLGIPALQMADGPTGVRIANPDIQDKKSTAFPTPIALAASWDTDAAARYGDLVGDEAYNTTHNVLLGPGFDIARLPWGSRNFESLGEDPLLQSKMGVAYVNGVQSHPVIATAKHYLLNNQETQRFSVDSQASERAMMEIYTRPFAAAIQQADLGAAMCSFNKINGVSACENETVLTDILRSKLGFQGFMMSDYGANLSTAASANAGLDLETPGEPYGKWGAQLLQAVQNGEVSETVLNTMTSRILYQMFDKGLFDKPAVNEQIPAAEHGKAALQIAEESMVLLQNKDKALPLDAAKLDSIAVIGPDADTYTTVGGSSLVQPTYTVTALDAIRERAGSGVKVSYAPGTDPISTADIANGPSAVPSSLLHPSADSDSSGLSGEYWTNENMSGEPTLTRTDSQVNMNNGFYNFGGLTAQSPKLPTTPGDLNGQMSARWIGTVEAPQTGTYKLSITSMGIGKLYLDGKLLIENNSQSVGTTEAGVDLKAGERHEVKIEYRTVVEGRTSTDYGGMIRFGWEPPVNAVDSKMQQAVDLAKRSDVAVVVVRTYESEGYIDRSDLDLPNNQDRLIQKVAAANPNTVVVNMSGRAVQMDGWQKNVKAILQAWYAGQEQGNAVARILFGDVNPSGKLPVTFPVDENSTPVSSEAQFPGTNGQAAYSEGVMVGYRGYEDEGIKPAFAFGHGLSYTTFDYSNVKTKVSGKGENRKVTVSLNVRNTGATAGTEVVQVYAGKLPTAVETAPKQLAGWARVTLKPGKQQHVSIELDAKALSYWDEQSDKWVTSSGTVPIYVGSASDDIRLKSSVNTGAASGK